MKTWTIKENQINDLDKVFKLQKDLFIPSLWEEEKYSDKDEWSEKIENGGKLLTVYANEELIGYAVVNPENEKDLRIWIVAVRSDYRRRGIWKEMYELVVDFAKEKGIKKLVLQSSKARFPEITHFAISNGFNVAKEEKIREHGRGDIFLRAHFEKEI